MGIQESKSLSDQEMVEAIQRTYLLGWVLHGMITVLVKPGPVQLDNQLLANTANRIVDLTIKGMKEGEDGRT